MLSSIALAKLFTSKRSLHCINSKFCIALMFYTSKVISVKQTMFSFCLYKNCFTSTFPSTTLAEFSRKSFTLYL